MGVGTILSRAWFRYCWVMMLDVKVRVALLVSGLHVMVVLLCMWLEWRQQCLSEQRFTEGDKKVNDLDDE